MRPAQLRGRSGHATWAAMHEQSSEQNRFALLLPITSRRLGRQAIESLSRFLGSFWDTTSGSSRHSWHFELHFGVDVGDQLFDPASCDAVALDELVRCTAPTAIVEGRVRSTVRVFDHPHGHVAAIWADLARDAYEAGCHYFVLVGDDVVFLTPHWADAIHDEFALVQQDTGHPFGVGCVAFADDAFPGFPTFPVIHRAHMTIFGGRIFPRIFVNQDVDPFLFQIYRAFGAARICKRAWLRNTIGGQHDARYTKHHVPSWSGAPLAEARAAVAAWLAASGTPRDPAVSLDVVVPSYRLPRAMLDAVLALDVPAGVSTQFTIVSDRPGWGMGDRVMSELVQAHAEDPFVRLRSNPKNLGAGPTRNRGLAESASDWVLFLDDDVVPDPGILAAYARAVRNHPHATGFIGLSRLPPPRTARQAGVIMAGVAFFWTAARHFAGQTEMPWGVTANLCVRRVPGITFDESGAFPKSGGGEDIDYCLRLRRWTRLHVPNSEGLVAWPDAIVDHPWWDGGKPRYRHFSGWARGDGHLIDLYPRLTYRNWPDLSEMLIALVLVGFMAWLATGALALTLPSIAPPWSATTYALATLAACAACIAADLCVDLYTQLWKKPAPECAALPLHKRVVGVVYGLVIRSASELGRIRGHLERGRLLRCVLRRFNWFGDMWPGAIDEERREALRRNLVRVVFLLLLALGTTLFA